MISVACDNVSSYRLPLAYRSYHQTPKPSIYNLHTMSLHIDDVFNLLFNHSKHFMFHLFTLKLHSWFRNRGNESMPCMRSLESWHRSIIAGLWANLLFSYCKLYVDYVYRACHKKTMVNAFILSQKPNTYLFCVYIKFLGDVRG